MKKNLPIIVYIDAPTFSPNSNGIRCLYFLAKRLREEGAQVAFLPRNTRGFRKNLPKLFEGIDTVPAWGLSSPATLICSESVPARTIEQARRKGIKILWWYLAPHGLLESPNCKVFNTDHLAVFSPYILPQSNTYFYFQAPLDEAWKHAISTYRPRTDHKRPEIALYCGKGRLSPLSSKVRLFLANSNIHVITRSSPPSRKELFELLLSVDGLITFDELSQLSLESATIGVPVLVANPLFPKEALNSFPIDVKHLWTRDQDSFIELIKCRRAGKIKGVSKAELFSCNQQTIENFLSLIAKDNQLHITQEKHNHAKLFAYGRELRSARVLYPHYGGQSAGTLLLQLYIYSLTETPNFHTFTCKTIAILDEIGRIMHAVGLGRLLIYIANKGSGSTRLQNTTRAITKLIPTP